MLTPFHAQTAAELAGARCQVPGCTDPHPHPLALVGRCHRSSRLNVGFDAHSGALLVGCHECKQYITAFLIAEERPLEADKELLVAGDLGRFLGPCGEPGCSAPHVFLPCHRRAPLNVAAVPDEGVLILACSVCKEIGARVLVAPFRPSAAALA